MEEREIVGQQKEDTDAEYRLNEFVYMLHQADVRCINAILKNMKAGKGKKNESGALHKSLD